MNQKENPSMRPPFKLFGLGKSFVLAKEVSEHLGINLEDLSEETFADGETKIKPLSTVQGHDVAIIQSMASDSEKGPNEKISELLIFVSLLKDSGAEHITAVLPYFSYSRSDQAKDFQDPVTLKYLAQMYEAVGINNLITLDVHNIAAFENAFRCPSGNLEASSLFCFYLKKKAFDGSLVVVSSDIGGIKRAEKFRRNLQSSLEKPISMAFLEKYREKEGLAGTALVGSVQNAHVIIYDDMISTGKTVLRAAEVIRASGALSIRVFATHGLFSKRKEVLLASPLLDEIVITNSNPAVLSSEYQSFAKLQVISCGSIIAESLRF